MGDRITERAEALALPWMSRSMKATTSVLAAVIFGLQVVPVPEGSPVAVVGALVVALGGAVVGAVMITTYLKMFSLLVRIPLSLYFYPD